MEEELMNKDSLNAYRTIAQRIRDNKGKDPGMEKAYHENSLIEFDSSGLVIIT